MPRGRRPAPGTAEEKAALRRERVRLNVQAFRKRKSGAESDLETQTKSRLRWVSDSKWQIEYDERRHQIDEVGDDETEKNFNSPTSLSVSSDPEATDDEVFNLSSLTLSQTPNLNRQYSYALLATVPGKFLPHRVILPSAPDGYINTRTPCALWITTATGLAQSQESGPLKDVLFSIVLAHVGQEQQRPDLTVNSHKLYTRSLTRTRRTLQPIIDHHDIPPGSDVVSIFLACHAAAVFEMFVNKSLEDMARHVTGIGFLIQHVQSRSDASGLSSVIGDSLMEEYRMLNMSFSMMNRRPTVLNRITAKDTTSSDPQNNSIFTILLDLADKVPPIMVEVDKVKLERKSHPSFCADKLVKLIPILLETHAQLRGWSDILREKLVEQSLGDIFSPSEIAVNPFRIASFEFASTWMFSNSYDCYALETAIEAYELLLSLNPTDSCDAQTKSTLILHQLSTLRADLLSTAGSIVEVMPYFLQDDKGIVGRSISIWPLECAWATLESEEKRLRREDMTLEKQSADMDLRIEVQERLVRVMKYLKMCCDVENMAKAYNLPMFAQR